MKIKNNWFNNAAMGFFRKRRGDLFQSVKSPSTWEKTLEIVTWDNSIKMDDTRWE